MLALYVSNQIKSEPSGDIDRRNGFFWFLLMILLIFLGVNRQFDLQSYVTAAARCSAHLGGWYEDRRPWQVLFILLLGVLLICAARSLPRYLRGAMSHNRWAIIGALFLLAFILLRASSFHYFDSLINYQVLGVRMNWILENSGLLMISIQSIVIMSKQRRVPSGISGGDPWWRPARSPRMALSVAARGHWRGAETQTKPGDRAALAYGSSTAAPSMRPARRSSRAWLAASSG